MQTKWIWGNIILSILAFCMIFYFNVGVSGGDMVIVIFNFMFVILQIIVNVILLYKSRSIGTFKIFIAIILTNIFLMFLFTQYGSGINSWIKKNYL